MKRSRAPHILVVDADDASRARMRNQLAAAGYCISSFSSGLDALAFVDTKKPSVSLLITAFDMPDMSGTELCTALQARGQTIPVVLTTSSEASFPYDDLGKFGVVEAFPKPLDPAKLLKSIEIHIYGYIQRTAPSDTPAAGEATRALTLHTYPDPVLRERAAEIKEFGNALYVLGNDMMVFMHANHGVGLAGPQVGIPRKIVVADTGEQAMCLVNPRVVSASGSETRGEGCLSLPDVEVEVPRKAYIRVRANNTSGKVLAVAAEGLLARVLQHEIDHLNGILICDHQEGRPGAGEPTVPVPEA